jgi:hypothetical protein
MRWETCRADCDRSHAGVSTPGSSAVSALPLRSAQLVGVAPLIGWARGQLTRARYRQPGRLASSWPSLTPLPPPMPSGTWGMLTASGCRRPPGRERPNGKASMSAPNRRGRSWRPVRASSRSRCGDTGSERRGWQRGIRGAAHAAACERRLAAQPARVVAGGSGTPGSSPGSTRPPSTSRSPMHRRRSAAAAGSMTTVGRETITTRTQQLEGSETPSPSNGWCRPGWVDGRAV